MKINEDRGSALIDFLGFGLFLQIPVLLLSIQVSSLQASQLAADSIARHSLRAFVLEEAEINKTANQVAGELGIDANPLIVLECDPDCTGNQSLLRLTVKLGSVEASSVMIR